MKIAVATENGMVAQHFGHCEGFTVYDVEENQAKRQGFHQSPEHVPGAIPNFVNSLGAKVVIAGGMGGGAIQMFSDMQIEVISGANGNPNAVVQQYLEGNLKSSGINCHEHQHSGECGGH